jgi:hypothetical protein
MAVRFTSLLKQASGQSSQVFLMLQSLNKIQENRKTLENCAFERLKIMKSWRNIFFSHIISRGFHNFFLKNNWNHSKIDENLMFLTLIRKIMLNVTILSDFH